MATIFDKILGVIRERDVTTVVELGLDNVDNTADADKPVSTLQAAGDLAAENNAKAYADGLVVGLWDDRGVYDASTNLFPAAGGSGVAGAIKKGDIFTISVPGTLGGHVVAAGDVVRALADDPAQVDASWAIAENNIGYVPENSVNKNTENGYVGLLAWAIQFRNLANTFTSSLRNAATAARIYTFPDKDITVAGLDDVALKETAADKNTENGYVGLLAWAIQFRNLANTFTSSLRNAATAARIYTFPDKDITVAGLDDIPATTAALPDSAGKRYVTEAEKALLATTTKGTAQTTLTTNETIATIAIPDDTTLFFKIYVRGRTSTPGNSGGYEITATVSRTSGGPAVLAGGISLPVGVMESDFTWVCELVVSGNNAVLQGHGATGGAEIVDWAYEIKVL